MSKNVRRRPVKIFRTQTSRAVFLAVTVPTLLLNAVALLQLLTGGGAWGFIFANGIIASLFLMFLGVRAAAVWISNGERAEGLS